MNKGNTGMSPATQLARCTVPVALSFCSQMWNRVSTCWIEVDSEEWWVQFPEAECMQVRVMAMVGTEEDEEFLGLS